MAQNKGWIKTHRSLADHWLWEDKPFSKGQAWIDLIMIANWQDVQAEDGGKIKAYQRGTVYTSMVILADRWGWDRRKVKRFLDLLQSDHMIRYQPHAGGSNDGTTVLHKKTTKKQKNGTTDGTTNGTAITIEKYTFYQNGGTRDGTRDGTTHGTTDGTTDGTQIKNIRTTKKEKEEREARAREESEQAGQSVDGMRRGLPLSPFGKFKTVMLTDREHQELRDTYKNAGQLIGKVDRYLSNAQRVYRNHYALIEQIAIEDKWPRRSQAEKTPETQEPAQALTAKEREQLDQDIANLTRKLGGGARA